MTHGGVLSALGLAGLLWLAEAAASEWLSFWSERDDANQQQVDHGAWQSILDGYLRVDRSQPVGAATAAAPGVHRFDYGALKENAADRERLAAYLTSLQALDPRRLSGAEQMAYWINFYNALTVRVVVDDYPVGSIREIHEGWWDTGPWDDVHARVAGRDLTLNDIEHRILRPIWRDERIHYAVNCASLGCPNLAPKAYAAASLEEQLEQGAKDYVNHPRGASIVDGELIVSSIYDWYQEDFGGAEAAVIEHLLRYADDGLAKRLRSFDGGLDYEYDWSLNDP